LAEDPGVDRLAELARGHAIDSADHGSTRLPRVSVPAMLRWAVPHPAYPPIPARSKGIAGQSRQHQREVRPASIAPKRASLTEKSKPKLIFLRQDVMSRDSH